MANTIRLKRNIAAGVSPAAGSLSTGELAINTADGVLFTKNESGTVLKLVPFNQYGLVVVGVGATARSVTCNAYANGTFAATGDAQHRIGNLRFSTSTATAAELSLDGAAASNSNTFVLPNNATFNFDIQVVARRTDTTGEHGAWHFSGCISRDATAATTALVGTVGKTTVAKTTDAWDCNVTADATNGRMVVTVTGQAAKTIRWVATVKITEVTA
jgi:hypothetical protein